jgi:[acyl-carrier-protein] S-malonyltransferase
MNGVSVAVAFPGQGSQRPGMGNDFYDKISVCRDTYHEASDILGWDVAAMCFGENEKLNFTEYVQPCILTTEIAMLRGLNSLYGFAPEYFGGHSLGEYTALVAADVLPFSDALEVVSLRGQLMQEATPVGMGGMAAVISNELDVNVVQRVLGEIPIDVANDNSTNQVVISGQSSFMPEARKRLAEAFGDAASFRFVPLNVSAPFHSRFMTIIKEAFMEALHAIMLKLSPKNASKVTSNFTGFFHTNSDGEIIDRLVSQLSGTVQWRKNMESLAGSAQLIIEIGPSRPLREFFKTIGVQCQSITTLSAATRLFEKKLS